MNLFPLSFQKIYEKKNFFFYSVKCRKKLNDTKAHKYVIGLQQQKSSAENFLFRFEKF